MTENMEQNIDDSGFKDFPKYTKNPFLENLKVKTKITKIADIADDATIKTDNYEFSVKNLVAGKENEIQSYEYVQIVNGDLDFLAVSSKHCLKILLYIFKTLKFNSDIIILPSSIFKMLKLPSLSSFYLGTRELLQANIIAKTDNANVYYINVNIIFKGNRLALLKESIKQNKKLKDLKDVISSE
jgi:hypothetical protein